MIINEDRCVIAEGLSRIRHKRDHLENGVILSQGVLIMDHKSRFCVRFPEQPELLGGVSGSHYASRVLLRTIAESLPR